MEILFLEQMDYWWLAVRLSWCTAVCAQAGRVGSESNEMQWLSIMVIVLGSFTWVVRFIVFEIQAIANISLCEHIHSIVECRNFCAALSYFSSEWSTFSINAVRLDSILALFYLAIISSMIDFCRSCGLSKCNLRYREYVFMPSIL